jgi:hypothetical protein
VNAEIRYFIGQAFRLLGFQVFWRNSPTSTNIAFDPQQTLGVAKFHQVCFLIVFPAMVSHSIPKKRMNQSDLMVNHW